MWWLDLNLISLNPSLDTTFYGTQRNCGNDPLDGELDLVKKFNEANKTYFDVYMLQLLLSDSGPVFTNKELNKILTLFQHLGPVKITYYQVIFFQNLNIELISTFIYSLMSNADKIMNEINIKHAILILIKILPHQSAYLNILFSTLKSPEFFPKTYIYKIKYTMIYVIYSSKMCMVSFFSCSMRYHKRLNIYRWNCQTKVLHGRLRSLNL